MTRRQRMEEKVARRQEWAAGRRDKAEGLLEQNEPYRGDTAFNTQPGHIPERARANRRDEKAWEHEAVARHHDEKAAGLEAQLERSIFSDDEDAIVRIEARIADNEAARERMKRVNALYRKGDAAGLATLGLDLEQLRAKVAAVGYSWAKAPHEGWQLSNLGNRIRVDRQRIEDIKRRRERSTQAEAAGGILVQSAGVGYVRVTFAEKPEREILAALRGAGFVWNGGSWQGSRERLPVTVIALAGDVMPAEVPAVRLGGAGAGPEVLQ